MTKEQAIEILNATAPDNNGRIGSDELVARVTCVRFFEALASAGAFTDGARELVTPNATDTVATYAPSRPVATEAWAITDDEREALAYALTLLRRMAPGPVYEHARAALGKCNAAMSRPVATCSKARAEEIRDEMFRTTAPDCRSTERLATRELIDALDRAGFFAAEATLSEIDRTARGILENLAPPPGAFTEVETQRLALRLANACRTAGLAKP